MTKFELGILEHRLKSNSTEPQHFEYIFLENKINHSPTDVGLFEEFSVLGNPLCLSSDSVSESKILGSELALALQLKGLGDRKLLDSSFWDLPSFGELGVGE